jgi:hypothetical protein
MCYLIITVDNGISSFDGVALAKASAENDINKLITTTWTSMTGYKYSTNKQGLNRHYTERWETK